MNNQKPIAVIISETKATLARTVNQIAQESGLSPSVIVTVLDSVKAQFMENVIIEMTMLYQNAVKEEDKGEE